MTSPTIAPTSRTGPLRPSPSAPARRTAGTIRLFRVSGIDVEAHWSWTFIVVLLVWSLAAAVFPASNPGLSDTTYAIMGVAGALLLFASLALHELGHALQARRDGMAIEGITLWLLGGVARFRGAFPSAGAEFRIAIAGPLVSLALGVVMLTAALVIPLPGSLDGVLHYLGFMNLVLLAFNMLPALPLDGGRVLRASLWARRGDLASATRTAVAVSGAFGRGMIGGGVVLLLLTGAVGGLWLALIGWFLLSASAGEGAMAVGEDAHAGPHVADVMVRDPVVVAADTSVERFLDEIVVSHRHLVYPVLDAGAPVGLVSFRDALHVRAGDRASVPVEQIMVPLARVLVLDADRPLTDAVAELLAAPLRRALVSAGGQLAGLLSPTDALRTLEILRRR